MNILRTKRFRGPNAAEMRIIVSLLKPKERAYVRAVSEMFDVSKISPDALKSYEHMSDDETERMIRKLLDQGFLLKEWRDMTFAISKCCLYHTYGLHCTNMSKDWTEGLEKDGTARRRSTLDLWTEPL